MFTHNGFQVIPAGENATGQVFDVVGPDGGFLARAMMMRPEGMHYIFGYWTVDACLGAIDGEWEGATLPEAFTALVQGVAGEYEHTGVA